MTPGSVQMTPALATVNAVTTTAAAPPPAAAAMAQHQPSLFLAASHPPPSTASIAQLAERLRSGNAGEQLYALTQLQRLSSNAVSNKDAIRTLGALGPAVPLLGSAHADVRFAALKLIRSLSVNARNQAAIAEAGAIPLLFQCLQSDVESLQSNAAATLWNLAADPENKATIGDTGGVGMLLSLLRRTGATRVRIEVCGALRNLSYRYENLSHLARHRGGVKLLVDALWDGNDEIRKNVAVALNMCMQHDEAQALIEREQCIPKLLRTLHEFNIELTPETAVHEAAANAAPQSRWSVASSMVVPAANNHAINNTVAAHGQHQHQQQHATPAAPLSQEVFGSIAWSGLELESKVGKGAFSDVYRARYHGFPVAVKLLRERLPDDERKRERLLQEYRMLASLRHPNVVLLMGTSLSPDGKPVFVSELCSRGALKDVLPHTRSVLRRLKFAKDIVAGLNWLHAHNIVHRDLKCANILVDEEYTAKISDLGLALLYFDGVHCAHFKGNVKYSAPEILAARAERKATRYPYGPQTDVYSFALILWELVTHQPLFDGIRGKEEITAFVCGGHRPPLVPGWPRSLQTMLTLCWHASPSRRPSFTAIQRDFPAVMVDVMCPDPAARKVCRALWAGKETRRVAYPEFERTFQQKTQIDLSGASLCYRRCLQAMLCDPHDNSVTFEKVCNLVHTFGQLEPIDRFLNNVVTLFEQPWFFGFVRVNDAKQMLTEQWRLDRERGGRSPGYYMFRLSDNLPGAFSIFTIDADGTALHRRVGHQYSSEYFITIENKEHVFANLFALHDYCANAPSVFRNKRVLPGSPYQCFFAANPWHDAATAADATAAAAPDGASQSHPMHQHREQERLAAATGAPAAASVTVVKLNN